MTLSGPVHVQQQRVVRIGSGPDQLPSNRLGARVFHRDAEIRQRLLVNGSVLVLDLNGERVGDVRVEGEHESAGDDPACVTGGDVENDVGAYDRERTASAWPLGQQLHQLDASVLVERRLT